MDEYEYDDRDNRDVEPEHDRDDEKPKRRALCRGFASYGGPCGYEDCANCGASEEG